MPEITDEQLEQIIGDEEKVSWLQNLLGLVAKGRGKVQEPPPEDDDDEDEDEDDEDEKCSKCGAKLAKSMNFCGDCGTQREALGQSCTCGETLAKGYTYCPRCGAALQKSFAEEVAVNGNLAPLMDEESLIDGAEVFQEQTKVLSSFLTTRFGAVEKSLTGLEKQLSGLSKSIAKPVLSDEEREMLKSVAGFADALGSRPRGTVTAPYEVAPSPRATAENCQYSEDDVERLLQKGAAHGLVNADIALKWTTQRRVDTDLLDKIAAL